MPRRDLGPDVRARRALVALAAACAIPAGLARADELPVHRFDVADGLAHSRVSAILQDRRGYLWIGTGEGLSRFDGARFVNFGRAEGLVGLQVLDVTEGPDGRIWVGTNSGGIAALDEDVPRFEVVRLPGDRQTNCVWSLRFAPDRSIWCSTNGGLFRGVASGTTWSFARIRAPEREAFGWWSVPLDDEDGVAGFLGANEWIPAEAPPAPARYPLDHALGAAQAATPDGKGSWLVACARGVARLVREPGTRTFSSRTLPIEVPEGAPVRGIARDREGTIWVGTRRGLIRARGGRSEVLEARDGLPDRRINALAADLEGNLWIGTWSSGLLRLASLGLVNYAKAAGFREPNIVHVYEDARGLIYASEELHGVYTVEEHRVVQVPGADDAPYANVDRGLLLDRSGTWWYSTTDGLALFRGPSLRLDRAARRPAPLGWPAGRSVYGDIHQASDGTVWLAEYPSDRVWTCTDPSAGRPRCRPLDAGTGSAPAGRAIASDRAGRVWMASWTGLWRYAHGRVAEIVPAQGWPDPERNVMAVFVDRRGRLWVGTRFAGAGMIEDVDGDRPEVRFWSTQNGLQSDTVWAITEDDAGRIYLGTGRGLDILEPDSGKVRSLSPADGLAGDSVYALLRARDGRIWLATSGGLTALDPRVPEPPAPKPPVYVESVEAAGEALPRGRDSYRLRPGKDHVRIEFIGVALSGPRAVRYQHRLVGLDKSWSRPVEARSVELAHLAPGSYRFEVRAVSARGEVSDPPATVRFTLLAPVWRRGWFLALVCAAAVAGGTAWHRARVRRALALERLRTQIATDLHDDIGSGLSQIAMASEIGRRGDPRRIAESFDQIAGLARALRESMGDIVWAVDPRHDRMHDLVQRMRHAATLLLEAEGVELGFHADESLGSPALALGPDRRRHLLLIFKEAVHNAARHAAAARVDVELGLSEGTLRLVVRDDGRGFDPARAPRGTGLHSLERRASELGGRLRVVSSPGGGTEIEVVCPIAP